MKGGSGTAWSRLCESCGDAMLNAGKDLAAARKLTTAWKEDYNHHRSHSSLGYLPPVEFAARCRPVGESRSELHEAVVYYSLPCRVCISR